MIVWFSETSFSEVEDNHSFFLFLCSPLFYYFTLPPMMPEVGLYAYGFFFFIWGGGRVRRVKSGGRFPRVFFFFNGGNTFLTSMESSLYMITSVKIFLPFTEDWRQLRLPLFSSLLKKYWIHLKRYLWWTVTNSNPCLF